MPSDASVNLRTSAAAALCARFLIHPLEHFRHHTANKPPQQCQQHAAHYRPRQHYTPRELILTLQKTYRGVSFALINVPALAFFLSTYDAAKHGQAHVATALQFPRFHLHHFENHLISGMMAKVAGTILWAPMAKLNSLQSHHPSQESLSFKNAFRLARQVCQSSPRGGGVLSLWSDYGTTLRALLPYTMLYFAVYEQLKQLARRIRSAYNGDTSNLYNHVTTAIDQQRVQQGFKKSLPSETS
ncbi:hypothetical protein KVV02_003410 [Mortierella alpina]|uniref:Uncharacterized protein n=1 Tax=Mortierella alpina TaxID=64518 RepID=A0A9P8A3D1_MORAP|nr:hypothetical protein KVV02_003410 [Mortierella alpina]